MMKIMKALAAAGIIAKQSDNVIFNNDYISIKYCEVILVNIKIMK